MTAYLQPGDAVHINLPMVMKHGSPDHDQMRQDMRTCVDLYASHGVTVAWCTANSALTAAVITAVFRNPKGAEA